MSELVQFNKPSGSVASSPSPMTWEVAEILRSWHVEILRVELLRSDGVFTQLASSCSVDLAVEFRLPP